MVCTFFKQEIPTLTFFCEFAKLLSKLFYKTPPGDCFYSLNQRNSSIYLFSPKLFCFARPSCKTQCFHLALFPNAQFITHFLLRFLVCSEFSSDFFNKDYGVPEKEMKGHIISIRKLE